jgi:predicted RNase H-like HicB family nuclease
MLKVSITVEVDRDGEAFYAHCPGLKGLHVDGATEEEAVANALQATSLYVDSMLRRNEPLPIGAHLTAEVDFPRSQSGKRTLSRNVEVPWPTAEACGVS